MTGKSAFTEDQINDFQETFTLFDTKGDGMIPVSLLIKIKSHMYNTSTMRQPRLDLEIKYSFNTFSDWSSG